MGPNSGELLFGNLSRLSDASLLKSREVNSGFCGASPLELKLKALYINTMKVCTVVKFTEIKYDRVHCRIQIQ